MTEFIDRLMDGPSCWPRWLRRAYLLTLPVSLPLWMIAVVASFVGILAWLFLAMLPFYATKGAIDWFRETWS